MSELSTAPCLSHSAPLPPNHPHPLLTPSNKHTNSLTI
eukprot:CCRYP_007681-RA/>CCRYP_007681-RA protein AED:0.43 eAED:0.43 QI:0/-1/0/1/-1/0/1/0/37